jgi:sensor histidine kinase YesM
MLKNILSKIVLLLFIVLAANTVIAQKKAKKNTRFKPPVVKTSFAGIYGSKDIIPVAEGKTIIDSSLKIVDAKGNSYTVTHYQFAFTRIGGIENDSTGVVSPVTDIVADNFTSTPLTDIWRKTIRETLTKGEQFHFTDIIVTDNKGNYFYAPEVIIGIK